MLRTITAICGTTRGLACRQPRESKHISELIQEHHAARLLWQLGGHHGYYGVGGGRPCANEGSAAVQLVQRRWTTPGRQQASLAATTTASQTAASPAPAGQSGRQKKDATCFLGVGRNGGKKTRNNQWRTSQRAGTQEENNNTQLDRRQKMQDPSPVQLQRSRKNQLNTHTYRHKKKQTRDDERAARRETKDKGSLGSRGARPTVAQGVAI